MADVNRVEIVDARRFDGNALTTAVARADLQQALDLDGGAQLVLDVARAASPDDSEVEGHTLTITLDRSDLEELLRAEEAEEIGLQFDPEELAVALADDEVEAHGLRERAAVLAVAVVGAGAIAGAAAAPSTHAAVTGTQGLSAKQIWASASPGERSAFAAAAQQQTTAMSARQAWDSLPASARQSFDRSGAQPAPQPSADEGGIAVPTPSTGEAALAGGAALLITGAALGARGHRRHPAKPA